MKLNSTNNCFFLPIYIEASRYHCIPLNSVLSRFSYKNNLTTVIFLQSNKPDNVSNSGPTQRASALAALSSAFNPSSSISSQSSKANNVNHSGGPTQRASALAALNSAFNSSSSALPQSNNKAYPVNPSGPTQRASALAALSSAFNPASSTKTTAPKPPEPKQGSQRSAAVAALYSVLTAETKKGESEIYTARSSRSSSPGPEATDTGIIVLNLNL